MPSFTTPEPITVTVDLAAGSLTLLASNRADTLVTVSPSDPSKDDDVAAVQDVRIDYQEGTLSLRKGRSWKYFAPFGGGGSIDVTVELPSGSHVDGSALGPLFAQGRLGTCTFTSRAGDIRVDEVDRLKARASAGSVVVGRTYGAAEIVTVAGGVRVRRLDGDATIKNANGHTEIGETHASLRVNGTHGQVVIERSDGDTAVRCMHGSVRIEQAVRGQVTMETSFGAIEVGVPDGTAAWLDATSQQGKVRNLLEDAAGPDEADQTVEVRATTNFGDIVVRRPHA